MSDAARARGITALFGGSFNPPHLAHVLAVAVVLARFEVDRVLVVPTHQHPFAKFGGAKFGPKSLASYEDRVKMCELAMGFLPGVEVSRVEAELGGESLTLRTVEHLKERHPDWELRFVMGADLVTESAKWHRWDRVTELAPPIVLGRAGVSYEGAPAPILPAISSTEVRSMVAAGRWEELALLVPRKVLDHVRARGLYAA
jgi:nicotinate-nucleotide adenylyltransferase